MQHLTCIDDMRALARRNLPRAIFDYIDGGAYTESTMRANERDLAAIGLRQRVGIDVDKRTTASTMLGQPVTMPVAIAPTGLTGLAWGDGEMLGARAAAAFGVPFTLSTMSICSIEDVAQATDVPFWFQLYVMRDRGFAASLIERATRAKCSALVVTMDLQVQGQRHRDIKNGLTVPPRLTAQNLLEVAMRPGWAMRVLMGRRKTFGNLAGFVQGADGLNKLSQWIAQQFDPTFTWHDVAWIRERWAGKMIVKGVLDVADARAAVDAGADAIVVSNHGGRQLDGAQSSIRALPDVSHAVGDRTEVWFDGGVRSGQDVFRALAYGARGVMIGRAFLYGLASGGQAGVTRALELIHKELDVTMALTGVNRVDEITPSLLFDRAPV